MSTGMDIFHRTLNNSTLLQEKIIKTDEVLSLLRAKKKEVNKADKKYEKLLKKFSDKCNEVDLLNSSWEQKTTELKNEKELMLMNHNDFINESEKKYQSACQKVENLAKVIEKYEKNESKINEKKLQENELKQQLNESNQTILNLKEECENLLQQRNDSLKRAAKLHLECDELKKSEKNYKTIHNLELQKKIRELENKLETSKKDLKEFKLLHEAELVELKTTHDKEIKLLKNQLENFKIEKSKGKPIKEHEIERELLEEHHKRENRLLKEQLEKLEKEICEERNKSKRKIEYSHEIEKLLEQRKEENKLLENQLKKIQIRQETKIKEIQDCREKETTLLRNELKETKGRIEICYNEKIILEGQLKKLNKKINDTNKTKENISTQTDYKDIYNVQDIFEEMEGVPSLLSPLIPSSNETSEVKHEIETTLEKQSCSVAVGNDAIIPSFTDFSSQISISTRSFSTDTSDLFIPINLNQNTLRVKNLVELIDAETQTIDSTDCKNQRNFEFTAIRIPEVNIFDRIPKNIKLKSRVTKKYKNNGNRLLNALKNSKLNLKYLVEKYIDTSSKFMIVSPSILKSDRNLYINCDCNLKQQIFAPENYGPCACQSNMLWANRHIPFYQIPCNYNNSFTNSTNYQHRVKNSKSRHIDMDSDSDSDENYSKLKSVFKEYKHSVIQKYITDKYMSKLSRKTSSSNYNSRDNSKNDGKNFQTKSNYCDTSVSADKNYCCNFDDPNLTKINLNKSPNNNSITINTILNNEKELQIEKTHCTLTENTFGCTDLEIGKNFSEITNKSNLLIKGNEKELQSNKEIRRETNTKKNENEEIKEVTKSKDLERNLDNNQILKQSENNTVNNLNVTNKTIETSTKRPSNSLTFSKRRQLLLRRISSNKNTLSNKKNTSLKQSNISPFKRKIERLAELDYKKQKLELFGSDSDSEENTNLENDASKSSNSNYISTPVSDPVQQQIDYDIISNEHSYSNLRIEDEASNKNNKKSSPEQLIESKPENITPLKEKVFKRPERNKFNPPSSSKTPINNSYEEFSEVSQNLKPSWSDKKQVNVQKIDLDVAQKIISDVATLDWDKNLLKMVITYLADKETAIVARLIADQAAKDFSQEFDKTFTPPAPLLTKSQQKLIVLIDQLEKNNLNNIYLEFLQTLEKKLLSEKRVEAVHPLTRLFVTLCKLKYQVERVRIFCCNAAYYMGDLILPVMFIVLTIWGDILPMAENSEDIPLAVTLVQIIYLKTCKEPGFNSSNLHRLLSDYYGYTRGQKTEEDVLKKLVQSYSESYSKTVHTAILILCKNLPNKWTYTQIKKYLLPLLDDKITIDNKSIVVSLIQQLISVFNSNIDLNYIIEINNYLSKYVIKNSCTDVVPSFAA